MNSNIIKFANKVVELCCQHGKTIKINVPKIKVVGSQSAGKSTLIKRIIEYDVLPMGENMVTRTPIHVRLHNVDQQEVVLKLSYLHEGNIVEEFTTNFCEGNRDANQKQIEFKQSIMRLTDSITGGKYNISETPIFVDVFSSRVINFSFVDLPGLIISTSTDKGQPKDLRFQIDNLVKNQLLEPNTIAMVVIRSGIDLVTDLGVGLINEIRSQMTTDMDFHTIGVLTKPDLLDSKMRNDLNFIIAGKVTNSDEQLSKSELMSEGYFVVNNNIDSLMAEEKYFLDNFDTTKEIITEKKYCVGHLRNHLQLHLINSINKSMPEIKNNLCDILKTQKLRALQLGNEMETDQEKMKYVISTISELSRTIRDTIKDDGTSYVNIGPKIGEAQKKFLTKITNLDPFSFEKTSDSELKAIIEGFNGFHLTSHVSIEQLVDKCIKDPQKKPVMLIKPISEEFVKSVAHILSEAMQQIFSKSVQISSVNSYPKFKNLLQNTIISNIKKCEQDTNKFIDIILNTEEAFVWSTDQEFREVLNIHYLPKSTDDTPKQEKSSFMSSSAIKSSTMYKSSLEKSTLFQYNYEPIQIRELASKYYATIVKRMRDFIIKIVIKQIINELSLTISDQLHNLMNHSDNSDQTGIPPIVSLIVENSSTVKERQKLKEQIGKIELAIKTSSKYDF